MRTAYLLPLTVFSLALAVAALGFRARRRRGYGPLALGLLAAALVVLGKFTWDWNLAVYGGLAALVGASVWNSWPRGVPPAPAETLYRIGSIGKGEVNMAAKRIVEVFSAGCPACRETIDMIKRIACPSCDVSVLDMNDPAVARRARGLGVRSVPAVVIDGRLADCCKGNAPDEAALKAAGLGQPVA